MKLIIALFIAYTSMSHAAQAAAPAAVDDFPDFTEIALTPAILKQLRGGGYVLYMRHGNTDTTRPDRLPSVDLNDCSTQRPLTAEGRRVAARVGREIRKARIPLGEIISSPMCRTRDSALAAFGPNFSINNLLMFTSNMTDKDKAPVIEATRELISTPVQGKVNRVLVAHTQNLMEIMGYLPKPEGVLVILKPMGNKHFKYIASVTPRQWQTLQP